PEDPDALWISTVVDPRDGTALPVHEIFHGRTSDAGRSWAWTPVTEGSAVSNFRPIAVPGDPSREGLAWSRGELRSSQADDTARPVHESRHGRTSDAGRSWAWPPVTEGSAVSNFRPIAVPGDPSREVLAWYRGEMRSSQAYDTEVLVRQLRRG